jgi:transcriptional regulator with XRE-family HTH domain
MYFSKKLSFKEKQHIGRTRIGKRLRNLRRKHNEKQKEVAELIGVSRSQITRIENGSADLKGSVIPILADKYGTYAETFFTENGSVSCDMLARLLNSVSLSCDDDAAREYLEEMVDRVITQGRSEELLLMFYTSIRTCCNYKKPLEHISEEMSKIDKVHSSKELEMCAKNWEIEH